MSAWILLTVFEFYYWHLNCWSSFVCDGYRICMRFELHSCLLQVHSLHHLFSAPQGIPVRIYFEMRWRVIIHYTTNCPSTSWNWCSFSCWLNRLTNLKEETVILFCDWPNEPLYIILSTTVSFMATTLLYTIVYIIVVYSVSMYCFEDYNNRINVYTETTQLAFNLNFLSKWLETFPLECSFNECGV